MTVTAAIRANAVPAMLAVGGLGATVAGGLVFRTAAANLADEARAGQPRHPAPAYAAFALGGAGVATMGAALSLATKTSSDLHFAGRAVSVVAGAVALVGVAALALDPDGRR